MKPSQITVVIPKTHAVQLFIQFNLKHAKIPDVPWFCVAKEKRGFCVSTVLDTKTAGHRPNAADFRVSWLSCAASPFFFGRKRCAERKIVALFYATFFDPTLIAIINSPQKTEAK